DHLDAGLAEKVTQMTAAHGADADEAEGDLLGGSLLATQRAGDEWQGQAGGCLGELTTGNGGHGESPRGAVPCAQDRKWVQPGQSPTRPVTRAPCGPARSERMASARRPPPAPGCRAVPRHPRCSPTGTVT